MGDFNLGPSPAEFDPVAAHLGISAAIAQAVGLTAHESYTIPRVVLGRTPLGQQTLKVPYSFPRTPFLTTIMLQQLIEHVKGIFGVGKVEAAPMVEYETDFDYHEGLGYLASLDAVSAVVSDAGGRGTAGPFGFTVGPVSFNFGPNIGHQGPLGFTPNNPAFGWTDTPIGHIAGFDAPPGGAVPGAPGQPGTSAGPAAGSDAAAGTAPTSTPDEGSIPDI